MCGCNQKDEQKVIDGVEAAEVCGCGGNCMFSNGNEVKKLPAAAFLIETGLLFQINRDILHPVGLALEAIEDENGDFVLKNLWDLREDPEGVVYSQATFESAQLKLNDFYESFGNAKIKEREEVLGYVYQGQHQVRFTK